MSSASAKVSTPSFRTTRRPGVVCATNPWVVRCRGASFEGELHGRQDARGHQQRTWFSSATKRSDGGAGLGDGDVVAGRGWVARGVVVHEAIAQPTALIALHVTDFDGGRRLGAAYLDRDRLRWRDSRPLADLPDHLRGRPCAAGTGRHSNFYSGGARL